LQREWLWARLRAGDEQASLLQRLRALAALWVTRLTVWALRCEPADRRALPAGMA
jgi:hypothetical protein